MINFNKEVQECVEKTQKMKDVFPWTDEEKEITLLHCRKKAIDKLLKEVAEEMIDNKLEKFEDMVAAFELVVKEYGEYNDEVEDLIDKLYQLVIDIQDKIYEKGNKV